MTPERHLPVPDDVTADAAAAELLRVWMSPSGMTVTLRADGMPAEGWGLVLVDVARHAASAYARRGEGTPAAILQRICAMMMAEIEQPTDIVQPGQ